MTSLKRRSFAAPWILSSFVATALALAAPLPPAAATGFDSLSAAHRLVDTRSGSLRAAGSTLRVPVAGVAGVPLAADSAVVNVTVDGATESGFVTVYPCDVDRPTASNLNFVAGRVAAVMVVTRLGDGALCAYTSGATHLVVDVSGSFLPGQFVALAAPQRLLDTRPGMVTADAQYVGGGIRAAGSVLHLPVRGRVDDGPSAGTVVLTVTADPTEPGFVTAYPCDAPRPNASAVNYVAGEPVANTVISKLSAEGEVCLFVWGATHVVVDIAGWPCRLGFHGA